MPPAARLSDQHKCGIPQHAVNMIQDPCATHVRIGGMPAARVGDSTQCGAQIISGSPTVLIVNQNAARIGDETNHGGTIVTGFATVLIGVPGDGA